MDIEQSAYVVIFAIPVITLAMDYWIDADWTELLIKIVKWPWVVVSIGWMVLRQDWNAAVFIVFFSLAFFLQPAWKDLRNK